MKGDIFLLIEVFYFLFLGIEDRLQDGVADCIQALRLAGIKVWVLTGKYFQ